MLHQNMARVWIVTKFPLPNIDGLLDNDRKLMPDCEYKTEKIREHAWSQKNYYIARYLEIMCNTASTHIQLLQAKEKAYKSELSQLIKEEIKTALPSYNERRKKRFAAALIPAVAGLVTLAVESLNGYLQSRRNKAISMAMEKLDGEQAHLKNKLHSYRDNMLMYGEFSMNSSAEIVSTLEEMYDKITYVEESLVNHTKNWAGIYMSDQAGAARYANDMALYVNTLSEKFLSLYRELLYELDQLLLAIKILSEGRIPIHLIPPVMLKSFTNDVQNELRLHHPGYTLAMPHISYYYDMKLVTFGVDMDNALVITFPIFIRPVHSNPMTLYEIETVHVPINDKNHDLDSYTKVVVNKPYIAANNDHYIQLEIQELNMCKVIQRDFFCEELFMMKQNSMTTCESALLYNDHDENIGDLCSFEINLNKTVIPSVLDGGSETALANVKLDTQLTCYSEVKMKLPRSNYILTNRSILCTCSIHSGLSFIPPDIGACEDDNEMPAFHYTKNLAFAHKYSELLENKQKGKAIEFPDIITNDENLGIFNLDLNKTKWANGRYKINTLKEWVEAQKTKLHKKGMENDSLAPRPDIRVDLDKITYLTATQQKFSIFTLFVTMSALTIYVIWLSCKLRKLKVMATAIALGKLPHVHSLTFGEDVVCQNAWISLIFSAITVIGICIWIC